MTPRFAKMAFAAALCFTAVSTASASDYYDPNGYSPSVTAPSVGIWHGLYVGAHLGLTSGSYDTSLALPTSNFEIDAADVSGGLFAGYNWQFNKIVLGAEADFTLTGLDDNSTIATKVYSASTDWKASMRGRLGYAANALMLYGTMGISYTDLELSSAGVSDDSAVMGWTLGAGGEVKLTEKLFARGEYLYADHSQETFTLSNINTKTEFSDHTFRLGLGYKY